MYGCSSIHTPLQGVSLSQGYKLVCFSLQCAVTVPGLGEGCAWRIGAVWSLLRAVLLTLAPLHAVVGSALCIWLCPVLWILVALRGPFSAVWVHPSLHCSFSPLLLVEANSLAPSNCCHWASAVVVFRMCNPVSPISFLAWCDVPLEQQHWLFVWAYVRKSILKGFTTFFYRRCNIIILCGFTVLTPLHL